MLNVTPYIHYRVDKVLATVANSGINRVLFLYNFFTFLYYPLLEYSSTHSLQFLYISLLFEYSSTRVLVLYNFFTFLYS